MPRNDQAKEQLLRLWAAVANSQSSCAWLNSVWAAPANYWGVVQQLLEPELMLSFETWKTVCRFWAHQPLSQETGLCWRTFI